MPATAPSASSAVNPIDAFIAAKLAENGLTRSPEADRRTLVRRLHFDLLGLAPTPEEAAAFERDDSADAYAKLVERLLASPRYGERWARHWLDAVRFAETTGFEVNTPRPNAWPYRDYVIRAFNQDKPYDRFIIEQLAGDALGEDAATGFLVAGPDDKVKSPDPVLTSNQRADELHDMVSTTGSAFLGLTIGCARCHDHKFDPIPTADYYRMKACFSGIQHGDRKQRTPGAVARQKQADELRGTLARLESDLAEFEPLANPEAKKLSPPSPVEHEALRLRSPVHPRQNVERFAPLLARRLRFTVLETSGAEPCLDELEVFSAGEHPRNVALASVGAKVTASGTYPNNPSHRLEHLNDGLYGNAHSWISSEAGRGWVQVEFSETVTINKAVWSRDRDENYSDRLATSYRIEVGLASNEWRVVAGSNDREAFAGSARFKPSYSAAGLSEGESARLKELLARKADAERKLKELTAAPLVYAGSFSKPEPVHRLQRGDPMQPREEIGPGTPSALGHPVELGAGASEQDRRLTLARWIADARNPLTARVMVNRLWQHHFGEGLVNTPSDFGVNGARPVNPGLLDWLAAEFMRPSVGVGGSGSGDPEPNADAAGALVINARAPGDPAPRAVAAPWSIKHMHRLIVMSATYRQAGQARQDCLAVDAGSRLLWRFPPRRLEAESIRDTILAVSGKLDLKMGGPGFSFFEPNENYVRVYAPRKEYGPDSFRRMVYGTVVRQRPDGVFGVFDCPDGGQIAPKRTRSTTPLQALNLLNSTFIMQQASFFAARLEQEATGDPARQIRRAFQLGFNRDPARDELEAADRLLRDQGLAVFCRALFNANEFVYVF